MPDSRFFDALGPVSLAAVAELAGAAIPDGFDGATAIDAVAPLERAEAGCVSFFADRRYAEALGVTRASACFITAAHADKLPPTCAPLVVREPHFGYVRAADQLHRAKTLAGGPAIDPSARLEADVVLSCGVVIGAQSSIGQGSRIGPNSVIGPGVTLGRNCVIGANVTISFALIGDRVRILAGAVIGEAGFGVTGGGGAAVDIPQLGRVILQDGVTVGANSCIDRGAWDDTVIGENTKIDNLVQIGHNVRIGRSCLLAAHTGISGSTVIGDGVRFGGRAGIADHLTIGDGASVMAAAGLMHNIPAGEVWGGVPATPARQWMRQVAWLARMARGRGESRRNETD